MKNLCGLLVLCALGLSACGAPAPISPPPTSALDHQAIAAAVRALLEVQQDDWNRGDVDSFMAGYWRSPDLRFASGGSVRRGWEQTRDRYHETYPDRAAMGTLTFSGLEIQVLAEDAAVVFGRWRLEREKDAPGGLYTLVVRRFDEGWRIVADHTSSE